MEVLGADLYAGELLYSAEKVFLEFKDRSAERKSCCESIIKVYTDYYNELLQIIFIYFTTHFHQIFSMLQGMSSNALNFILQLYIKVLGIY